MPLSLILFDLDETLFDHQHASRSALEALRQQHAVLRQVTLDNLTRTAYQILERTHARVLSGELTAEAARVERLRLLFGTFDVDLDEPECRIASRAYVAVYRRSRRAIDGAHELLESLGRHYRIGIVTNNFRLEQESKLADCGLTDAIDFMITSEETGCPKPEPGIFNAALECGRAAPSETVMVGDSWNVDIVGALNVGIRPVWFNRLGQPRPGYPRVEEVRSLEPLDPVLRAIEGRP